MIATINNFWFKLSLAIKVFFLADSYKPFIDFENFAIGKDTTLILKKPLKIHCLDNVEISSARHIFMQSGKTWDADAETSFGIWLNSDRDEKGNPIIQKPEPNPKRACM